MMKRRMEPAVLAALLCCLVSLVAFRSLASTEARRGPAGPRVDLDCGREEEKLSDPEWMRVWLPRGDCIEHHVARLEIVLAGEPRINSFGIRSGAIALGEVPPSSEWEVGASSEYPESPAFVIPVRFDEPLRWEPYIAVWLPHSEITSPARGRLFFAIGKANPTPEGFEIHLAALGGTRARAISVAWVAYDTTVMAP